MKFLSIKGVNKCLIIACLLMFTACKKEVIEVNIDAFSQLNPEVTSSQGVYNLRFSLQTYPYKEVRVRMSKSKDSFFTNTNLTDHLANKVNELQYGIFVNNLSPNETYYYQINVKDSASAKEIYSDVFSFKTVL